MRTFIASLIFILLIVNVNFAQESKPKNDNNKPVITFGKLTHDYGTIPQKSIGTCEFKFTNTGKLPLILSNVKSSCGCTIPSWTKNPVPRKKNGVIKVKYNTNRVGSFQKSITVYSNAKNSQVTLIIKGKVEKKANNNKAPVKDKPIMKAK